MINWDDEEKEHQKFDIREFVDSVTINSEGFVVISPTNATMIKIKIWKPW